MSCTDSFGIDATIIANEFIEKYMPDANGDYVKVYLYLLRYRSAGVEVSVIAETLHLTEGDVRRAIKYWEEKGIVSVGRRNSSETGGDNSCSISEICKKESSDAADIADVAEVLDAAETDAESAETAAETVKEGTAEADDKKKTAVSAGEASEAERLKENYKNAEGRAIINDLREDEDFAQLLFIVQKYLARLLKERDLEVLAYLYHGLKLPCEVIDYLTEYCAEHKHTNIRYIEKVGIDWAEAGIRDLASAKRRTTGYEKELAQAKEKSARKKTVRADRQGIMRDYDIDEIIKKRVLEKL